MEAVEAVEAVGVAAWEPTTQIFATPCLLLKPSASTLSSVTHVVGWALGGTPLSRGDGTNVGSELGASVGRAVGPALGEEDGKSVGATVGAGDGKRLIVGSTVGDDGGCAAPRVREASDCTVRRTSLSILEV